MIKIRHRPVTLACAVLLSSGSCVSGEIALMDWTDQPDASSEKLPTKCDGQCMPFPPPDVWEQTPVLVWHGPSSGPIPGCPTKATARIGRDPIPPLSCPLCECGGPACVLSDGLIADGSPSCGPPGPFLPFPPESEGLCSNRASFEPNAIQSVAVLPPTVSKCVGTMAPVAEDIAPMVWNTIALVCFGEGVGPCDDPHNETCVPSAPPGFRHCIKGGTLGQVNAACPAQYPNRHVYYNGIDWQGACTACECSPPVGSDCKAELVAYSGEACTSDSMFLDVEVELSPGPPPCYPVPPNTGLRGLIETWIVNQPGKCDPRHSVPTGVVKGLDATALELCCADPDFPDP